jgi:hypothetical protein
MMRRTIIALSLALFCAVPMSAQSFLDHLQKENQGQGQGSVSVKQSDDISNLVNGKNKQKESSASSKSEAKPSSSSQSQSASSRTESRPASHESSQASSTSRSTQTDEASARAERERERARQRREDEKLKEEARREALKQRDEYSSTATTSSRGSVKKVMRGGRRIDGYMVQVWSGGNTREDKMKAEQVGQEMKSQMPTLPVYVHFYSPRWACRIGNFKKQDEATALVKKLKKLGYRSACVVKASLITRTYK